MLSCIPSPVIAHAVEEEAAAAEVMQQLTVALIHKDREALQELLADSFQSDWFIFPAQSSARFIDQLTVAGTTGLLAFDSSNAQWHLSGTELVISPVVADAGNGVPLMSLSVRLRQQGTTWLVVAISHNAELPGEQYPRSLNPAELVSVEVNLIDGDNRLPVAARVHVADSQAQYWPPVGHQASFQLGFNQDVGGNVLVAGKRYAYVRPNFTLQLPVGRYRIEVQRGPEYQSAMVDLEVLEGQLEQSLTITLQRWIHMKERGWYSADTHVHFLNPQTALLEASGEDLNVTNILATGWAGWYSNVNDFTGGPSKLSTAENIVYVNEESRHASLAHLSLLNLKRLVTPLTWAAATGEGDEGDWGGFDYPPAAEVADRAKRQGGFVAWSHLPFIGGELAVDMALGKVDGAEILILGNPMKSYLGAPAGLELWYRLLNTGFKVPALAGTDKMKNIQVVGSSRVYARVEGEFSYAAWIDALKAGRTFVTTGPMLDLTVDGRGIGSASMLDTAGSVSVVARVESAQPVAQIELVMNGEVVAVRENPQGLKTLELIAEVKVERAGWLAARAWSDQDTPYNAYPMYGLDPLPYFAHTSPVYLKLAGQGPSSAEDARALLESVDQLIDWVKHSGRYRDEAQKTEVIELYRRAREVYLEQIETRSPKQVNEQL